MADTGSPSAAQARALLEQSDDVQLTRIQELLEERAALNAERKRKSKDLKNEMAKRKRLLAKAKHLSTEDLLAVVVSRSSAAKAKAKAKAKARA